mgnify:CR=1 FL=1
MSCGMPPLGRVILPVTLRVCTSTTLPSTYITGLPTVPTLRRAVDSSVRKTVGPVSVMPKPKQSEPERPAPRLYLVTPEIEDAAGFARSLPEALGAADVAAVLLRLKEADERTQINRIKALVPAVQSAGVALVLVMLWRPAGLWPSTQRQRELADEDDDVVKQEQESVYDASK